MKKRVCRAPAAERRNGRVVGRPIDGVEERRKREKL